MTTGWVQVSSTLPVAAETRESWPAKCIVCEGEHERIHWSKSRAAALKHRQKKHPWLGLILAAERI